MNDVARVESWFQEGRLLRPGSGPSTLELAGAIAAVVGATPAGAAGVRDIAGRIGQTEHLVFVLADGFGTNLMDCLPEPSPLRNRCAMQLDAVFPSSTAPALTSIATGQSPARHGLLFWHQYLPGPAISVTTLPFIERFTRRPLHLFGLGHEAIVSEPPQVVKFPRDCLSLQPAGTVDSVYTRYYTGGTARYGYQSLEDAMDTITVRLTTASGPTYTYLYFSDIDRVQHDHGPASVEAVQALRRFDAEVARLADAVSGRARIVISADHGQFRVDDTAIRYFEEDDELLEYLRCVPSGEGPAPAFHLRPEANRPAFEAAFRNRFGEEFALLNASEVEELRLLGPEALSARARAVLGDYLAVAADAVVLRYRPRSGPMPGDHGGMLPDEIKVPLIVI